MTQSPDEDSIERFHGYLKSINDAQDQGEWEGEIVNE